MTKVFGREITGDNRMTGDLAALNRRSASRIRPLNTVVRAARERGRAKGAIVIGSKLRWATASLAAAVVLVMLLVPFSHEAVVAHDLTLTLSGPAGAVFPTEAVAAELGSALGGVLPQLGSSVDGDQEAVSFTARVPRSAGVDAAAVGEAFASALRDRGYRAEARVVEHRERVSGTLYAMVRDNVIQVDSTGKSTAEIAAEIASRLAGAGIPGAQVSVVKRDGETLMDISIPAGEGAEGSTTVVLGSDDAGFVEDFRTSVHTANENGVMVIEVVDGDHTATARVEHAAEMTDNELAGAVLEQLAAQGVGVSVSVQQGQVTLIPTDKLLESQGTSWSDVKRRAADKPR